MRLSNLITFLLLTKTLFSQNGLIQDVNYATSRCYTAIWIIGKIYDSGSKEALWNATIGIRGTKLYCLADSAGQYALNVMSIADTVKTFEIIGTYVGYRPQVITVSEKISGNLKIDFALTSEPTCNMPDIPYTKKQLRKMKRQRRAANE